MDTLDCNTAAQMPIKGLLRLAVVEDVDVLLGERRGGPAVPGGKEGLDVCQYEYDRRRNPHQLSFVQGPRVFFTESGRARTTTQQQHRPSSALNSCPFLGTIPGSATVLLLWWWKKMYNTPRASQLDIVGLPADTALNYLLRLLKENFPGPHPRIAAASMPVIWR